MKRKTIGLALAFCFLAGTACFASPQEMGTWKLNRAKSKLFRWMGRNDTVLYQWFPFERKVTIDGVDAHGRPMHSVWEGDFDGKDAPVTGDPSSDSRAYTEINDHTLDFVSKKGGKWVANGRVLISEDGKSRTVTTISRNRKGHRVRSVAVYDKQLPY